MAATDSAPPAASASPVADDDAKSAEKHEKLTKVEKPDEAKFQKDVAEADKHLSAIQAKIVSPQFSPRFQTKKLIVCGSRR